MTESNRNRLSHQEYHEIANFLTSMAIDGAINLRQADLADRINGSVEGVAISPSMASHTAKKLGITLLRNGTRQAPAQDVTVEIRILTRLDEIEAKLERIIAAFEVP